MKRKVIGFGSYGDGDDLEEEQKKDKDVEALKTLIQSIYSPDGITEQKEFKTTAELIYELREMIPATGREMRTALSEMGFEIKYIDGTPMWVMYQLLEVY